MRISRIKVGLSLCFFLVISGSLRAQGKNPQDIHKSCRIFVQGFYNQLVGKGPKYPRAVLSRELRRRLKEDDEAQARDTSGYIVGLDFDPIAGGNDICTRYIVGKISLKSNRYWVEVYCIWGSRKEEKPHMVLEVMSTHGRWIIVNFHYYHYEKGKPTRHSDLLSILKALREDRQKNSEERLKKIRNRGVLISTWSVFASRQASGNAIAANQTSNPKGIKIGLLDTSKGQYQDGCGCSFWPVGRGPKFDDPGTQKYILSGNYDKQAWMNIDGKIVQLRLVKDTTKYKGRIGDRYYQTYRSGNITVNVKCVASGFGDTHAVYCDATITVTKGVQKQTVKAEGSCGC